jgi:hypothetical protein
MAELAFKQAVFQAKSQEELEQNLYDYWNQVQVDEEIDLEWLGDKPKYKERVSDTLLNFYQQNMIHAIWLNNRIRRTF